MAPRKDPELKLKQSSHFRLSAQTIKLLRQLEKKTGMSKTSIVEASIFMMWHFWVNAVVDREGISDLAAVTAEEEQQRLKRGMAVLQDGPVEVKVPRLQDT